MPSPAAGIVAGCDTPCGLCRRRVKLWEGHRRQPVSCAVAHWSTALTEGNHPNGRPQAGPTPLEPAGRTREGVQRHLGCPEERRRHDHRRPAVTSLGAVKVDLVVRGTDGLAPRSRQGNGARVVQRRCRLSMGGDGGTRTPNPRLAKAVLCQLSYVPEIHVGGPILGPDLELAVRSAQVRRRGGLRPQVLLLAPLTPAANECSSRGDQRGNSEQLSRHKALLTSRRSRRTPAVGLGGLEPPASSLSGMRSNRLSYRPGT